MTQAPDNIRPATLAAALKTMRIDDGLRITLAPGIPAKREGELFFQLAECLLARQEQDPHATGRWIASHFAVVMHDAAKLPARVTPVEVRDNGAIRLHLPMQTPDLPACFARTAHEAYEAELLEVAQPATVTGQELITGSSSGDKGAERFDHGTGGNRTLYDPRVERLPEGKAHTLRDLRIWGLMRQGFTEGREKSPGSRWLWEKAHDYLLSDEALTHKEPHRWFRDMCVICGVSTTMLEVLTPYPQSSWSAWQVGRSKAPLERFEQALSCVLMQPVTAGRCDAYQLPAGALFGLHTVEKNKKTIVEPAQLRRIMRYLSIPHKQLHFNAHESERCLRRLEHISHAYMEGAVTQHDLLLRNGRQDKCIYVQHPFLQSLFSAAGYTACYALGSTEYAALTTYCNGYGNGIAPLTESLRAVNASHLHIPDKRMNAYVHAVELLPSLHRAVSKPHRKMHGCLQRTITAGMQIPYCKSIGRRWL